MPRTANKMPSIRITITTTPAVKAHLENLVGLGIYGRNTAEVAERLICETLRKGLNRKCVAVLEEGASK